ncbi:hypothetical protein Nepgr_000154 [Nepenthes gracilis]|uniref:Uncharacterized protein n=1 Tax=Nepenthes gracilis TaxID=150966 RepID=A0AAD3P423_NEPGR|nr:hypothetical protein Nepgr_000154 [Nepenthes gracilis]
MNPGSFEHWRWYLKNLGRSESRSAPTARANKKTADRRRALRKRLDCKFQDSESLLRSLTSTKSIALIALFHAADLEDDFTGFLLAFHSIQMVNLDIAIPGVLVGPEFLEKGKLSILLMFQVLMRLRKSWKKLCCWGG